MKLKINFEQVIYLVLCSFGLCCVTAKGIADNNKNNLLDIEDLMIAYYPLDGDAIDHSGNSLDGILNGPTSTSDLRGLPEQALLFDGINDTSTFPSLGNWGEELSFSFWVKSTSTEPQILIGSRVLGNNATLMNFFVSIRDTGNMRWMIASDGTNSDLETSLKFPINQWVHVVTDFSTSTGMMNIYWNGKLVANSNIGSNPRKLTDADFGIGGFCTGCGNNENLLAGQIDEVYIHGRLLDQNEISLLAGITAEYQFDDQAQDSSGNERHGTIQSAIPTTGVFNPNIVSAYAFDGISSLINIPSLGNWGNELGFSLWFKANSLSANEGQVLIGSRQSGSGATPANFVINITPDNAINWKIYSNGPNSTVITVPNIVEFDQWTHLACDWSELTGNIRLFINGDLIAVSSTGDTPRYLGNGVGIGNYNVGFDNSQAPFHGVIDQVKVMNRVFTETEVLQLADVIFKDTFED